MSLAQKHIQLKMFRFLICVDLLKSFHLSSCFYFGSHYIVKQSYLKVICLIKKGDSGEVISIQTTQLNIEKILGKGTD